MADENAGRRLPVALLDNLAKTNPDRNFVVIPNGTDISDGFRDLTIREVAQAVNYTSWWIQKVLGPTTKPETVSYMASNDVRYVIFVWACNKTGYTPFLVSTRNSDDAFIHLLKVTNCRKFVYSPERKDRVLALKNISHDLETFEIPSLSEMLTDEAPQFPYDRTFDEEEYQVATLIHSSGTTGLPKPVPLVHGFFGAMDRAKWTPVPPGRHSSFWSHLGEQDLMMITTPFFHVMGYSGFLSSLFHGIPFVAPPNGPISSDLIVDLMDAVKPTAALLAPSILEEMSHSDRALDRLSRLKQVHFGGAPLSAKIGDRLCEVTKLICVMGSSEVGFVQSLEPDKPEDWKYYEWNPEAGIDMQLVGGDIYELVIKKSPGPGHHGVFHTFPDISEYRTKDTFIQHPTKPNKWIYHGRVDDIIVFSNGEKLNPVTMEKVIEGHPLVSSAIIAGQGRFQSSLIVEPNWDAWSEQRSDSDLINEIWATVQQANETGPAYGRVLKSKIAVVPRGRTFTVTAKGSVQRQHVYKDFAGQIEAAYRTSGEEDIISDKLPDTADIVGTKVYVRKLVSTILGRNLEETEDFYAAGLDSLQTTEISRILQGAIRSKFPDRNSRAITPQKLYVHPTIEQLSSFVSQIMSGEENRISPFTDEAARARRLDSLLRKYTEGFTQRKVEVPAHPSNAHTVLLTGSTGSMGGYLLDGLLNDPHNVKIYCLNRAADAGDRQKKSFLDKGLLWDQARERRTEFVQASFGAEQFGLENNKYEELLRSVDTIIHNAWKVDFNHSVATFEHVHIEGVRRFIDFSLQSAHCAHFHFVSSVSTTGAWKPEHGPFVPEVPVDNPAVVLAQGYGESKYVAERICAIASQRTGVPTTVLRVGQVGGPTLEKGVWNRQEWLPTIIATSKALGKIPTDLGSTEVDWIPVDKLATIILELVETRRRTQSPIETRCTAFNLVNPSSTTWKSLVPAVQQYYQRVKPVDLATWIAELEQIEKTNPSEFEVANKPALKLLDFYRGLLATEGDLHLPMEQTQTKEASATMRDLRPVNQKLLENWLKQWSF